MAASADDERIARPPSRFVSVGGKIDPQVSFSERSCLLALLAESLAALSKASFAGLIEDRVGPPDTLFGAADSSAVLQPGDHAGGRAS